MPRRNNDQTKKSIMLRTTETDRINRVKDEFKNVRGVTLTTEDIFIKGLDVIEEFLIEERKKDLDYTQLGFMQKAIIEDALANGVEIEYLKAMNNKEFKVTQLGVLAEAAKNHFNMLKFLVIANPDINIGQMQKLIDIASDNEITIEDFEVLASPTITLKQFEIMHKVMSGPNHKKHGVPFEMTPEVLEAQNVFFEKLKAQLEEQEKNGSKPKTRNSRK